MELKLHYHMKELNIAEKALNPAAIPPINGNIINTINTKTKLLIRVPKFSYMEIYF